LNSIGTIIFPLTYHTLLLKEHRSTFISTINLIVVMLKKVLQCILILCCFWSKGTSQITCDFTYTSVTGCGGFAVDFCDMSSSTAGAIVGWSWNMEISAFSVECPSTVFSQPGVYTVCLTVTDSEGNTCTVCKDDLVQIYNLPTPNFSADITQGCTPLEVTYTDLSSGTDGNIVDWIWGLGGSCGTIPGNGTNPVATCAYTIPGSYNVSLIVTDDNGCVNTTNKLSYINVSPKPPLAISAVDTFACNAPYDITFINNSNAANVSYTWDFGNNDTYVGSTPPAITYDAPGAYTVTVVAMDIQSGCTDTLILEDYINIGYPASFSYTPENGCEDLLVSFTDNSTFVAQSIVWDFGDGSTSTLANPTHLFTEPGCFTVQLTRIVDGCTSVVYTENCINVDQEPDLWYTNDNLIGCTLPHVVNFSGVSINATEWLWNFGDGNTSTLQNPTHSYEIFGEFPVVLTVTNALGCTNDTLINTINTKALEGQLLNDFYDGCVPLSVTLEDASNTVSPITSWSWEATGGTNTFTSNEASPTFLITDTGVYNVVLITTNTLGCIDTAYFNGAIEAGLELDVNFEGTPLETCIDSPVEFTDLTPGAVDEWFWDFGDGGTSILEDPEYSYADTGYYDVSLIVVNNGCFNSITFDDYIHAIAPVAKFELINFCENQLLRQFVNNSIGADSTFWDFGVPGMDTDTSSLVNPQFVYPGPGTYTVVQWVYNSVTMCSHSASLEVMVTVPIANFSISPNEGCAPLAVTVTDVSIDAVVWQWASVNGVISNANATNPTITYNQPGLYTDDITLIVTDVNECQDTIVYTDSIFVDAVSANFTSDITTGCAPLSVSFSDLSVNDYFADVVGWNWNFGPGLGTSSDQNPNFTFDNLGTYDVILTVTDSWGCSNTITVTDYIDATSPIASFTVDTLSCTSHDIPFQSNSSGWQLSYSWDFGDGGTGTGGNPLHQYITEGIFTACVTITDGYGCTDFICKDIVVADPVAGFTVDSTFASCPPLPVKFTNTSINSDSYLWDFGDNNAPSDFVDPSYVYITPGVFDVTLIAIRTESCQDTLVFTDLIVLDGPVGEFTISIDSTCAPAEVTFVANSVEAYTYFWDFGEGTIDSSDMPIIYDSITYIYENRGTFTPTLSLLNSTGCFRTLPIVSTIYVAGLDADFEASKTTVCGDDPAISFTPIIDSTEPVTSLEWIFENGNPATSTVNNPISNFSIPGSHDVTLISESRWCLDTLVKEDYIGVGEVPIANFIMMDNDSCGPVTIGFMDMSTVMNGSIEQWSWDFGDGTTSIVQNPVHVFEASTGVAINLEVTTEVGCTDSYFDFAVVFALADIDVGQDALVCTGEAIQLHGTINTDTSEVDYYWEPAAGLSCVECLDPWVLNPTDTITYTLVVINAEGCPAEADVTVFVKPIEVPNIVLPTDTTLCANELMQIVASVDNNVTVFSYQWDANTPGLSCYDNCFNPVASPEISSTYAVTVTTTDGCSSVDSISIGIENMFQPFLGPDRTICIGDSITLDASFGNDPQWLISTDLTCAYCPDPIAFPTDTTTYIVNVRTDMGCLIVDTITINTLAANLIGAGEDFAICEGEIAYLQGFGPGQITWSPVATLNDPNILTPEGTPVSDTEYTIMAINGECSISDSILVEVNVKTELGPTDFLICEGDEITLNVDGFADIYDWSPGEGLSNTTVQNPTGSPVESTEYTVVGSLGLCEADTTSAYVEVIPAPKFVLDEVRYYLEGQMIQLGIRFLEATNVTYQWFPEDGLSCSDCESPSVTPEYNRTYTLTVTDEDTGCTYARSIRMEQLTTCSEDLVGVPNVFSPNDDNVNDALELIVSPTIPEVRLFSVYDRWGGLVYTSNNQFASWDGTFKGQKLQEGVYVYFVQFICGLDGTLITKKGDITLIR
jgi:gliding motility-associated-like protein